MVIPALWMGPAGPVEFENADQALLAALDYEERTGELFPRFATVEEAEAFTDSRSITGGPSTGDPLAQRPTEADLLEARKMPDIFNDPRFADIPFEQKVILAARASREGDRARAEAQSDFLAGDSGDDWNDFLFNVGRTGTIDPGTNFTLAGFIANGFDAKSAALLTQQIAEAQADGVRRVSLKNITPRGWAEMEAGLVEAAGAPDATRHDFEELDAVRRLKQQRDDEIAVDRAGYLLENDDNLAELRAVAGEAEGDEKKAATVAYNNAQREAQLNIGIRPENVRLLSNADAQATNAIILGAGKDEKGTRVNFGAQGLMLDAQLDLHGDDAQQVLEELVEAGLPPELRFAAILSAQAGISADIEALANPANDPFQRMQTADITDLKLLVAEEFDQFNRTFGGVDFSGAADAQLNAYQALAVKIAARRMQGFGALSAEDAAASVRQEMITNMYHLLNEGQIIAHIPLAVNGRRTDKGFIQAGAEFLLSTDTLDVEGVAGQDERPGIEQLGLDLIIAGPTEETSQTLTNKQALNEAFWTTNGSNDGMVLVMPFGRSAFPIFQRAPDGTISRVGRTFEELQALGASVGILDPDLDEISP